MVSGSLPIKQIYNQHFCEGKVTVIGCRGGFGDGPGSESRTFQPAFVLSVWKQWAAHRCAPFISLNRHSIPIPNYCFRLEPEKQGLAHKYVNDKQ